MRIDELTGVKAYYDKQMDDLVKLITKPGAKFKKAGSGATAMVFSDDDGYVYKFWMQDPAYEKYVNYCLEHQDNPAIPIFYTPIKTLHTFFKRPASFPDTIRYIKMEKLAPYTYKDTLPGVYEADYKEPVYPTEFIEWVENFPTELRKELTTDAVKKPHFTYTPEAKLACLNLLNVITDLKKLSKYLDLHGANIMKRGKTLVITDPMCSDAAMGKTDNILYAIDLLRKGELNQKKIKSGPSHHSQPVEPVVKKQPKKKPKYDSDGFRIP